VLIGLLALTLAGAGVGWWHQDLLKEQYRWRWVMGPSLLTVELEKEKAANPGSDFKECANGCPAMIVVPAGKFIMGSPESEIGRSHNEGPQHEVTIARSFAVSRSEVTFAQWDACIAAAACAMASDSTWGRDDRPVINVSWDDAKRYVAWLSHITGKDYRLLTEAEWEYAARAGSSARFTFGEAEEQLDQYAWYSKNSGRGTQPVAKKKANAFGLHDMDGNVSEWCEDMYHDNYNFAVIVVTSPHGCFVSSAAVPGASIRISFARPTATGSRPTTGSPSSVSVWPGR
jgi:formylglycine-generating enzyme required for sulfatase activity